MNNKLVRKAINGAWITLNNDVKAAKAKPITEKEITEKVIKRLKEM